MAKRKPSKAKGLPRVGVVARSGNGRVIAPSDPAGKAGTKGSGKGGKAAAPRSRTKTPKPAKAPAPAAPPPADATE